MKREMGKKGAKKGKNGRRQENGILAPFLVLTKIVLKLLLLVNLMMLGIFIELLGRCGTTCGRGIHCGLARWAGTNLGHFSGKFFKFYLKFSGIFR